MCVIAFVHDDKHRLTTEQIDAMWKANNFGGGLSWRETLPDGTVQVRWLKGLSLDEMQTEIPNLSLPYIAHFRNPSNGTSHAPEATHPFPLELDVPMKLSGTTIQGVMFHNGFWQGWKDKLIDWSLRGGFTIPSGGWSDSRGLAFIAANLGNGILDLIDEKTIIMTPTDIESFGAGWTELANGLFVSNVVWQNPPKTQHHGNQGSPYVTPPASMAGGTTVAAGVSGTDDKKGKAGGSSQKGTFRTPGFTGNSALPLRSTFDGGLVKDPVQKASSSVVPGDVDTDSALEWATRVTHGTTCHDCEAKPGSIIFMGQRRCYECWTEFQKKQVTKDHGTCEFCGKLPTTMLTLADAKWICTGCWRSNGKPNCAREQDLTPREQQNIQARRAGGSL